MQISLNIVLDNLQDLQIESHLSGQSDKAFDRIALLPSPGRPLFETYLYVCKMSEAMQCTDRNPGLCYLCLRDRIQDESETEERLSSMMIINENMEIERLFSRVQDVFMQISNWVEDMRLSVIHGKTLQDIMDLSEPILQNFIAVSDSALKLLAYTKNIASDDPVTQALVEKGYHPEETVRRFKQAHRFETWEQTTGYIINNEYDVSQYPLVSKVFKFHNTYFTHAVMTCNNRPITAGLLDEFQLLVDVMALYAERDWTERDACSHIHDSFLIDLLEETLTSERAIEERARFVNIPYNGKFSVFKIFLRESDGFYVGRIGRELSELLPNAKILLYKKQIILLNILKANHVQDQVREASDAIEPFLKQRNICCGASGVFHTLLELKAADIQAGLALQYGEYIHSSGPLCILPRDEEVRTHQLFTFEDGLLYHIFGNNHDTCRLWNYSIYCQALKTLDQYDEKHGSNNLELLYNYLIYERRPTDTAAVMHMHRNNVVYRVGRIEELLGMDLNDQNTRFKLMISYVLLRMYGLGKGKEI